MHAPKVVTRSVVRAVLGSVLLTAPGIAGAADFTWANNGTDWGTPANWIPPGPPGANGTPVFNNFSTGGLLINPQIAQLFQIQSLTAGVGPNLGGYTFGGSGSLAFSSGLAGGVLATRGTQAATFNGPAITGFGPANTAGFNIGAGSAVVISGASVANSNIGAITLRGGSLVADNTGGNPATQRIATAVNPVMSGTGSSLDFRGNVAGTTFNGLTGTIQLNAGSGAIQIEQPAGATGPTSVVLGGLNRANPSATLNIVNTGAGTLGAGGVNPSVTFTTAPTVRQGVISASSTTTVPLAYVTQTTAGGAISGDWADYGANGVTPAAATLFTGNFNAAPVGTNVKFVPASPGTVMLSSSANQLATVNFAPAVSNVTVNVAGTQINTLGIMHSGPNDMSVLGGSLFSANDPGARSLVVADPRAALFTSSSLAASNNPVGKSGDGFAILTGAANQVAFTSPNNNFSLNGGTLRVTTTNFNMTVPNAPALGLRGGTLEYDVTAANVTFNRALGTTSGTFNWSAGPADQGSGGFSAFSNNPANRLTVNVGGGAPATLTWGGSAGADANFLQSGSALRFGSLRSNATVTWVNPVNLDGGAGSYDVRTIFVTKGVGNTADKTQMTGVIGGSATTDLIKAGNGVLEFTAANTYVGRTIVQDGVLLVNNTTGSGTGRGALRVQGAGRIGGAGTIAPDAGNDVAISGELAPGDSAGTIRFGQLATPTAVNFNGRYMWELATAGGPAAPNTGGSSAAGLHDLVDTIGTLTIDTTVDLTALTLSGFDPAVPYSWTIAQATGGVNGVATLGTVNGTDFLAADGFFTLNAVGTNLFLNYTPVPEPATVLALSLAAATIGVAARHRNRWLRKAAPTSAV